MLLYVYGFACTPADLCRMAHSRSVCQAATSLKVGRDHGYTMCGCMGCPIRRPSMGLAGMSAHDCTGWRTLVALYDRPWAFVQPYGMVYLPYVCLPYGHLLYRAAHVPRGRGGHFEAPQAGVHSGHPGFGRMALPRVRPVRACTGGTVSARKERKVCALVYL